MTCLRASPFLTVNPVVLVSGSFLMHYAYDELGELVEEMPRSFNGQLKKDIDVKSMIGAMLP